MLVIRLFRTGKKNQPFFKVVVTDKRRPPRGGRFVEQLGFLNPLTKEKSLNAERIKYWLSKGAKPSDTIYNLLIKEKILEGKKIALHKKKKEKGEPKPVPPERDSGEAKPEQASAPTEEAKSKEAKEPVKEEVKESAKETKQEVKEEPKEEPKKEEKKT